MTLKTIDKSGTMSKGTHVYHLQKSTNSTKITLLFIHIYHLNVILFRDQIKLCQS